MPSTIDPSPAPTSVELDEAFSRLEQRVRLITQRKTFYGELATFLHQHGCPAVRVWSREDPVVTLGEVKHPRWVAGREHYQRVLLSGGGERHEEQDLIQFLLPCKVRAETVAVLEAWVLKDSPKAEALARDVLTECLELALVWERDQHDQRLAEALQRREMTLDLARDLHRDLDLSRIAMVLANRGSEFVGCDRFSVLLEQHGPQRLRAVSGVEQPNRRTRWSQELESLCQRVAALGDPFWSSDVDDTFLPVVEAWERYQDHSDVRVMAVLPLMPTSAETHPSAPSQPVGVVVAEWFFAVDPERQRMEDVAAIAVTAMANARQFEAVPLHRWTKLSVWWQRSARPRNLLLFAVVTLLIALCWPVEFRVTVPAKAVPVRRQHVFAPADGLVERVHVNHGDLVRQGTLLAGLHAPELEFHQRAVAGELQTTRERLHSVEATRMELQAEHGASPETLLRLSGEHRELQERLLTLTRQQSILRDQSRALTIRSPIQGKVVSWNVQQELRHRPVDRGDTLLTVVDETGPWTIEASVPDRRAGHVLHAWAQPEQALAVTFMVDAQPQVAHTGRVVSVGAVAMRTEDGICVPIVVKPDQTLVGLRTGSAITAKIHCGRRLLGYVWLHELWEGLRKRWM